MAGSKNITEVSKGQQKDHNYIALNLSIDFENNRYEFDIIDDLILLPY